MPFGRGPGVKAVARPTALAGPVVTGCSPNSGTTAGGTSVTITGTGFYGTPTAVTFGGDSATSIVRVSNTSITCVTPARTAGGAAVVVTTSQGASAEAVNAFTYTASAGTASSVTGISPDNGAGTGGTAVTITGTGFADSPVVSIGGNTPTSIVYVNSTTITCVTPAHAAGATDVVVANQTLAGGFTYTSATFVDTFSTGAKAADQNGYGWRAGNNGSNANGATVVSGNGYAGRSYSLSYPFTASGTNYIEQRIAYGASLYEVWFQFPFKFPANYSHPSTGGTTYNNKFVLCAQSSTFATGYLVCNFELYPTPAGDGATDFLQPQFTSGNATGVQNLRSNPGGKTGSSVSPSNFVGASGCTITLDTYALISVHLRVSTAYNANDGCMRLGVDGVWLPSLDRDDVDVWNQSPRVTDPRPSFNAMYLMGADNINPLNAMTYYQGGFELHTSDPGWDY